jgi:MtN3 and saliva related transmembrane protein
VALPSFWAPKTGAGPECVSEWNRPRNVARADQQEVGTNKPVVHCRAMNTAVGLFAAICTTASYFPQLKKCWETNSAGDLSLKMFLILTLGVTTWIFYGYLQSDLVIIVANSVSLCLLLGILYFKLKELRAKPG